MQHNPDALAEVYTRFAQNAFSGHLGIELVSVSAEAILIKLELLPHHRQNLGFAHGGLLATLADVCMGFAAVANARPDSHVLTGDLRISYLNPASGPVVWAKGYPIKVGSRLVFTEAEVYQEAEGSQKLLCKASATMVVVAKADVRR